METDVALLADVFESILKLNLADPQTLISKSIKFGALEIKDSLNFLSSSLDSLVKI